jgi:hypothetical protein
MHPCQTTSIVVAALVSGLAFAYQPLITDDTGTQGSGGNQLELSWQHGRDHAKGATPAITTLTDSVSLVYTRGLTDSLDGYVGATWQRIEDGSTHSGQGNPVVGMKWRFYETSSWSLGIKPEVQLPVSRAAERNGMGRGKIGFSTTLILTHGTGFGDLHANIAYARVNGDASAGLRKNQWRVSLAPAWKVSEHWQLALDLGAQTHPDSGAHYGMGYVLLGAIYSPREDLDFSCGYQQLILNDKDSQIGALGVTWRFR